MKYRIRLENIGYLPENIGCFPLEVVMKTTANVRHPMCSDNIRCFPIIFDVSGLQRLSAKLSEPNYVISFNFVDINFRGQNVLNVFAR